MEDIKKFLVGENDILYFRKYMMIGIGLYIYYLFGNMSLPILPAVIWAFILSLTFATIQSKLQNYRWLKNDKRSAIFITVVIVGFFAGLFTFSAYNIFQSSNKIVDGINKEQLSEVQYVVMEKLELLSDKHPEYKHHFESAKTIVKDPNILLHGTKGIGKMAQATFGKAFEFFKGIFGYLATFVVNVVIVLFFMNLFLSNRTKIVKKIPNWLSVEAKYHQAFYDLGGTISTLSKSMLCNGLIQGVTGAMIVNVYFAFITDLSFHYYILNTIFLYFCSVFAIPFATMFVGGCSVLAFADGNIAVAVLMIVLAFGVGALDNIPKKIFGDKLGLGFVFMTIYMGLGFVLFGLLGMFLGPVLLIIVRRSFLFYNAVFEKIAVLKDLESNGQVDQTT